MSNQEPDGWVRRTPFGKLSSVIYDFKTTQDLPEFTWEPIYLISPQELSRLRAIEAWAIEASSQLSSAAYQSKIDRDISESLIISYNAITAPEDKEKV